MKFRKREKITKKLRRWFLFENNYPPESITETWIEVRLDYYLN